MIQAKIPEQSKKNHPEEGFTMLEVLFSILIIFAFLMGALQAMVYAAVFRVKALEKSEATTWIQQDLEYVRYKAYDLTPADETQKKDLCDAGNTSSGYANKLKTTIMGQVTNPETKELLNRTYTLTRTFTPKNTEPYDILEINYIVTDPNGKEIATIDTEVIPDAAFDCT